MAKKRVLILGAGFAGLELATGLSESVADEVDVTLIDQNDSFTFGFSKLDVLFGREDPADIRMPYADISKEGVEFRQERVTAIDPDQRRVETDGGSYEADVLAIAMGAGYDFEATPGFAENGYEYYSVEGAERTRGVIPEFDSGRIVIGILGHPFKCPPAPFEGALLLHDHFTERGIRDDVEIRVLGPQSAPVPVTDEVSGRFVEALGERDIEYGAKQQIVSLDDERAHLESGDDVPYDLFIGVPVHRVPKVVESVGLSEDGWIPVDKANLRTRFDDVYAIGDCENTPGAKAGVFAESAARAATEDIIAKLRGGELEHPNEGAGHCYLEFGGGRVAKVEANFFGGPKPTAKFIGPSTDLAAEKKEFAAERRERWFG